MQYGWLTGDLGEHTWKIGTLLGNQTEGAFRALRGGSPRVVGIETVLLLWVLYGGELFVQVWRDASPNPSVQIAKDTDNLQTEVTVVENSNCRV